MWPAIQSVVEWVDVFTRRRYVDIVLESLRHCQRKKGLVIYGWVIMSNYLHMIARSDSAEKTLSDIIRDFKKYTSIQILNSIKKESGESRRNWMLWIFSKAGERNVNNKNYQLWQQKNHPEELISNYY